MKANPLSSATRAIEIEQIKRLQMESWRLDPMLWLEERFLENPRDYRWTDFKEYADHKWDGSMNPLHDAWVSVASGNWAGIEAATGCHAKGTPILMFDGMVKNVEDVQEGDILMGNDSTERNVLSLARGRQQMAMIAPVKGEYFVVNLDHILSLKKTGTGSKYKAKPDVVNVSVRDYLQWGKHDKHLYKLYRTGVDFDVAIQGIDPYIFGLWLGDGSVAQIGLTTVDLELKVAWINYFKSIGYNVDMRDSNGTRCPTYFVSKGIRGGKDNLIKLILQHTIRDGEKRIPHNYLVASRQQRLQLLAGIVDTDGSNNCSYNVTTKYAGFADDIAYLCRSLGFAAYVTPIKSICQGMTDYRDYYSVSISGDLSIVPVRLERKMIPPRRQIKDVLVTGFKVTLLDEADYYGFELDNNHLYVMGDFTVTHNTSKTFMLSRIVLWFLDVYPDSLVVTSAPKQAQLTLHLWAEIQKIFHKFKRIRPKAALYNLRLVVEETDEKAPVDLVNADLSKSWQAVGFVAGVGSEEQSATKAQGFHRKDMLIIVEETPGMPSAIMTAFMNTCTGENNIILAVGNPDSQLDPLHVFCSLNNVDNYRVSAYDFPNVVLKKEIMPGAVTIASIERRKLQYGDVESGMFLSRVRGISPSQSADSLIHLDWIIKARDQKLAYNEGYHAVGIDVARSTDGDKAALAWFRGNQLEEIQEFHCPSASHLAYNLFMQDDELHRAGYNNYKTSKLVEYDVMDGFIGIDTVGVGASTLDTFLDNGFSPVSLMGKQWDEVIPVDDTEFLPNGANNPNYKKPLYKFQNLRSQMLYELRIDFQEGNIKINMIDETEFMAFCKEAISIKFKESGNYIVIESKENIKKRLGGLSPNKIDALAYANWVRKGYRVLSGMMPVLSGLSRLG